MDFLKGKAFILAPMAGFTNDACRSLFLGHGAAACVSEFVYSRAVTLRIKAVMDKISFGKRPCGIQIFGSDPAEMAEAALIIEGEFAPDFLDINFGCPAPNAVCAGAGSALLKTPDIMAKIVEACVGKVAHTPITAKMRLGWGASSVITPAAALALERAGASMLTLHGRTKVQGYAGDADWQRIEECAAALKIPLIGNGSVEKLEGAALRSSGCAGFMIGRAALGNPWIFENMRRRLEGSDEFTPSAAQRVLTALNFAKDLCECPALQTIRINDLRHAKPQIMPFLKGFAGFKKIRLAMSQIRTFDELKHLLTPLT